jgi:hypothetical protein
MSTTMSIVFPGHTSKHRFEPSDTFLDVFNFAHRECSRLYWFDRAVQLQDVISIDGISARTQIQRMLRDGNCLRITAMRDKQLFPLFKKGSRIPETVLCTTDHADLVHLVFPPTFKVTVVDGLLPRGSSFTRTASIDEIHARMTRS